MKNFYVILFALLVLAVVSHVSAASLQLTKIGTLETNGKMYSQWWYSGMSPTLLGLATNNAQVDITIDSDTTTVYATDGGTWSYTPASLTTGDHTVKIDSSGETISFTLTLGSDVPQNASDSSKLTKLPQTGGLLPIMTVVGASALLLGVGFKFGKNEN